MNIFLVHQYFLEKNEGGGSRFNEMVMHWAEEGHHITVLAGMVNYATGKKNEKYKSKYIKKEKYDEHIKVIRCHVSEAYNRNFFGRLYAYFSFVISGIIAVIFKTRGKYDVVISSSPPLFVGIIGYFFSRLKKIPFIFEVRDLWPESAIDMGVLKNSFLVRTSYRFEKFIYKKASLIIVLTPAFRDNIVQKKRIPENKIRIIPNAADFSISEKVMKRFDRNEFREKMGWNDRIVFIYVGAHGVANHLIQILEVAELLTETNAHFVLIGNGMKKPELIKYAMQRKLQNVEFIDPVSRQKIFEYISAADAGISVLKKSDTFKTIYSNKTFDYMACKRPVIMVIDGISRKLIEEASGGIYVEPENIPDFKEKIMLYLQNPSRIEQDGNNGYVYVKKNFDRRKLSKKYLKYIHKIINTKYS